MTLPLQLGAFRPGLNRIEISAQVPTPEDATCDPTRAAEAQKRFLLLDSTQLRMPQLARIGRAPDLAVTATGGFPFIGAGKQPKIFLPSPDRESIAAAATLAGRMAVSAGRAIDFRLTLKPPAEGSGATLAIVGGRDLDDDTARRFGVDGARLREAWKDRYDAKPSPPETALTDFEARARARLALQNNQPAACHMSRRATLAASLPASPAPATPAAAGAAETGEDRALIAAWNHPDETPAAWRKTSAVLARAGHGLGRLTRGALDGALQFAGGGEDDSEKAIYRPGNSLLVAQAALGAGADDVWTLVAAPNSALLAESVNCLADARVWRQVEGRLSALDASDGHIASLAPGAQRFVATQPLSASNLRLIAASWLSLNSSAYVALSLAAALLFGLATFGFVRTVGRRQECD